jgi:mono/diheme cytochrome c family protein
MRTWMLICVSAGLLACGGAEAPPDAVPVLPLDVSLPTDGGVASAPVELVEPDWTSMSPTEHKTWLMEQGQIVYMTGGTSGIACITCHQENGMGVQGAFPPLVGQGEIMGDCATHAGFIINGLTGELVIDGLTYNGVMPPQANLSDLEIAAVITYERNSWGNDYGLCFPEQVKAAR